ncbi:MAG: HAMP domain-containing sensor histidine kinase [bacterium]
MKANKNKSIQSYWKRRVLFPIMIVCAITALLSLYYLQKVEDYRTTSYLEKIAKKITTMVYDHVNYDNYGELTDIIYDFGKTYDVMIKVVSPSGSVVASYPSVINMVRPQVKTQKTYRTSILLTDDSQLGTISVSLPMYTDSNIYNLTTLVIIMLIVFIFLTQFWSLSSIKALVSEISKLSNHDKKEIRKFKFLETKKIYEELLDKVEVMKQYERNKAIVNVTSQVAHDIRSPLSALNMVTQDLKELPEEERIIIRSAVQRIEDIANDLASKKGHAKEVKETTETEQQQIQNLQNRLLPSIISSIISEKRTEYRTSKNINISAELNHESYGLFAEIEPKEFKRILSNLINNAVEAMTGNGEIRIGLSSSPSTSSGSNDVSRLSCSDKTSDMIAIAITDSGKGIPEENIPKLMQKGVSFGKEKSQKSGSGLGLYHAKETIESWGGKIFIESKIDFGTSVTIFLPKQFSPDWFLPEINIPGTMKYAPRIVILDDDESIHRVWDTRFNEVKLPNENVYHFYNPDQIINWYTSKKLLLMKAPLLVLCDYELLDCDKTGLQVIEELGIEKNAVLVTSHYEERNIRNNCARLGVKLLPKNLAGFVPISVIEKDEKTINDNLEPKTDQNCDAILIDDDYLVHTSWNIIAKRCGKIIRCYADPKDFVTNSKNINKSTPLYIDSNLGDDVKGEELAKEYFEQGFENIYLATGYSVEDFPNMPWIKGVVGKEPPFLVG